MQSFYLSSISLRRTEFQPGVPWKGIDRVDPESDPYMTPGSVLGSPGPPSLNDSDHQLLRDNIGNLTDWGGDLLTRAKAASAVQLHGACLVLFITGRVPFK